MKNFEEIGKALVCFHIGRGGRFYNPGHKSYNPYVKCFSDLTNQDWLFLNNEDEEGNTLEDENWTLTDCSGNVLLEGRDEIEAETGTLSRDGEYDADVVKRLEDCDESELELVYKNGFHHTLMPEDLLAYCCWRMDWKMIDTVDYDGEASCIVRFTDGTSGTISFTVEQTVSDTIDDFFTENNIDEKSREKYRSNIETEYEDLFKRFTLYCVDVANRVWECTDHEHGIVCRFRWHQFNEIQQIQMQDDTLTDPMALAKALREMGDWLAENHKDVIFNE